MGDEGAMEWIKGHLGETTLAGAAAWFLAALICFILWLFVLPVCMVICLILWWLIIPLIIFLVLFVIWCLCFFGIFICFIIGCVFLLIGIVKLIMDKGDSSEKPKDSPSEASPSGGAEETELPAYTPEPSAPPPAYDSDGSDSPAYDAPPPADFDAPPPADYDAPPPADYDAPPPADDPGAPPPMYE